MAPLDIDFLYIEICCRPSSADSRTENFISIGQSVAEIFHVEVAHDQQLWQQFSFYSYCFLHSSIANMAANYICIKVLSKVLRWKEMTYGSENWCMGRADKELKNYAWVWLISICIIN